MDIADLIITVPGTNTAEAAALGKPMLAVIPFNKPEVFLLDGIAGILGNVPLFGRLVKKAAIWILNRQVDLVALPNRKAGKMIIPEMRGVLKAEDVAIKALEMLADKEELKRTGLELKDIMGKGGAAVRIADEVASLIQKA
jgi:lipid-A-disaccharide synthase